MMRAVIVLALLASLAIAGSPLPWRNAYAVRGQARYSGAVSLAGADTWFTDTSTNLLNGLASYSIVCWYRNDVDLGFAGPICQRGSAGGNGLFGSGANKISASVDNNGSWNMVTADANSTTGLWHFAAISATTGSYPIVYFDGVAKTGTTLIVGIRQNANRFRLGGYDFDRLMTINGRLDNTAIFTNRALSKAEFDEYYNSGNAKAYESLSTGFTNVARYWKFDDGLLSRTESNAFDSASSTTATGTGINSNSWVTPGKVPLP